jgi:hypothetical protein
MYLENMCTALENNLLSFYPVRNGCITKILGELEACNAAMTLKG